VKASLDKISFNAVSGKITFDASHNPIKSATILAVKNNQIVFDSVVNP
jgi:branched-chain amino acid transport system substrate-binding protein